MKCDADYCDLKRGFIREDGTCYTCDAYYVPLPDIMTCKKPVCPENFIVNYDGQCEEAP